MATREYLVDVAIYQGKSVARFANAGAKGVIVKGTEGAWYRNPIAVDQVKSAHHNHLYVHMYHFANFSNSVTRAKQEAKSALAEAKHLNISKKRYICLDWEASSNNSVINGWSSNTRAIMAFMSVIKEAGYKCLLYSGASLMRNNIQTSKVIEKFGDCLWVASYATSGRIDKPNFNYFPSMNGVALWQFTDNWHGLNVDGNISLIDLHAEKKTQHQVVKPKPAEKSAAKIPKKVFVPVINNNPKYMVRLLDSAGHYQALYIPTNSSWKVWEAKTIKNMKCYRIGTDKQWVPDKFCKV
ncbi:lysin [Lactobacillus amylovorus GRL 1112]|uniref:Lysozyme n=1 Tax=Lactobacillus amylovorus (strain GRL 1112) TaxID=695560 RepID=E4SKF9_LACAR|nr:GH25 family lysozyme [Lactobacillus amylovorus]ADQ59432.1 lysin [Lactobacillus amylovorus GRL 1112]